MTPQRAAHPARPALRANRSASLPMASGRFPPVRRPRFPSPSSGCCRRLARERTPRVRPRGRDPRPQPGGRSSRSLRQVEARFPASAPGSPSTPGIASEKPAILAAATRSATSGRAKTSPVASPAAGLTTANHAGATSAGTSRSPMPVAKALVPARKKGTSAPRARPIGSSRSSGQSRRQRRLRASSVDAASELPPPRPAPHGTCLSTVMSAPSAVPEAACSARAARRLRSSAGSAAAMSWRRSSPSLRGSTWIVSHQSISTISDSSRCMPSARRPTTCRYRFSLAGAGTS